MKPARVQETLASIYHAIDPEKGKDVRAELVRLHDLFAGINETAKKPLSEKLIQRPTN